MVSPELAKKRTSFLRLSLPVDLSDGFDGKVLLSRNATMNTENLSTDDMGEREQTEELTAQVAMLLRILRFNFSFEAINLIHGSSFVVASRYEKVFGVEKFEANYGEKYFSGPASTIYKIAIK